MLARQADHGLSRFPVLISAAFPRMFSRIIAPFRTHLSAPWIAALAAIPGDAMDLLRGGRASSTDFTKERGRR
jgi:hypothetical protein